MPPFQGLTLIKNFLPLISLVLIKLLIKPIHLCINIFACPKINQYSTGLFVSYSVKHQLHENIFIVQATGVKRNFIADDPELSALSTWLPPLTVKRQWKSVMGPMLYENYSRNLQMYIIISQTVRLGRHFLTSLMSATKAGASPSGSPFLGFVLECALYPTKDRLVWKGLLGTNTLAFQEHQ